MFILKLIGLAFAVAMVVAAVITWFEVRAIIRRDRSEVKTPEQVYAERAFANRTGYAEYLVGARIGTNRPT